MLLLVVALLWLGAGAGVSASPAPQFTNLRVYKNGWLGDLATRTDLRRSSPDADADVNADGAPARRLAQLLKRLEAADKRRRLAAPPKNSVVRRVQLLPKTTASPPVTTPVSTPVKAKKQLPESEAMNQLPASASAAPNVPNSPVYYVKLPANSYNYYAVGAPPASPPEPRSAAVDEECAPEPSRAPPAPKKTAPASKKGAPASKKTAPASKKAAPASKKAAPTSKKPKPASKKTPPTSASSKTSAPKKKTTTTTTTTATTATTAATTTTTPASKQAIETSTEAFRGTPAPNASAPMYYVKLPGDSYSYYAAGARTPPPAWTTTPSPVGPTTTALPGRQTTNSRIIRVKGTFNGRPGNVYWQAAPYRAPNYWDFLHSLYPKLKRAQFI